MHVQNNKPKILCLAHEEFINSLKELKEHLDFNLIFSRDFLNDISLKNYNAVIFEVNILDNKTIKSINKTNKIKILLNSPDNLKKVKYDEKISFPISILEFNKKITQLISSKQFSINSALDINGYLLDKNEKKLKKNNLFIIITEKEIQLLELLHRESKPLPKKTILSNVWNYSENADTHTVETHIYRLRKKILDKFNDENFIKNIKEGYII